MGAQRCSLAGLHRVELLSQLRVSMSPRAFGRPIGHGGHAEVRSPVDCMSFCKGRLRMPEVKFNSRMITGEK